MSDPKTWLWSKAFDAANLARYDEDRLDPDEYRKLYMQDWPVDPERGSGRTTKALKGLGQGGIYIVLNSTSLRHTKNLMHFLGRMDIRLMVYAEVEDSYRLLSQRPTDIEVDHAVWEELRRRNAYFAIDRLMEKVDYLHRRIQQSKPRKDDHG